MAGSDATQEQARHLKPLSAPPDDKPRAPSRPCAACGTLLDPLRAERTLIFDDGFRYFCDEGCVVDFRNGARHRGKPGTETGAVTVPYPLPSPRASAEMAAAPAPVPPVPPWPAVAIVCCALILGFFSQNPNVAFVSCALSCAAAVAALWNSWPARGDVGWLAWALGPAGVVGAAIAAYTGLVDGTVSWLAVEGAAFASGAMVARAWFDAEARRPISVAVHALSRSMPTRVHIPTRHPADPTSMSMEWVDSRSLRTGEEVVVMEGEVAAVDGVVQAGEARVLPFPGATTPLRRTIGDPLLAGASVIDGAIRVLATRVADNRALIRLAQFGKGDVREPAPTARVANEVTRWGGLATVALALGVLGVAESGGLAVPLSAASAVLLAAPLLAVRRAAESPLVAAAAAAGARGVVYQSARALDTVGRVSVVAMTPQGILTEGKPEVVEIHPVAEGDLDALIAMAAAAESAAADHPMAQAIIQFARDRHLSPQQVRRPTFLQGRGVTALAADGSELVVGNRRLLLDEGISVAAADAEAARTENTGRTPIYLSLDGRVRAVMSVQDGLRVGARPAVQRMFDLNLEVVLLTGDQRGAVESLATGLDVAHIKSELLPEERGKEVENLRQAGGKVAAIGRPGFDDASLAAADVGIVLGAAGGTSGEKAVALVSEDVRDAAAALWIAHAARIAADRAMRLAGAAFAVIVAAAASGLVVPGIAALLAVAVDAYCVRAGARLLRRIALRLPART